MGHQSKNRYTLPHIFVSKYILSSRQLSFHTVHPQGQDCFISELCIKPRTPSALNVLLIKNNKYKKKVCKIAFSICIHLVVSQLQMCLAYKPTDLFNPASQNNHVSDNPKEQFPSFTLFPIKKTPQDGFFKFYSLN